MSVSPATNKIQYTLAGVGESLVVPFYFLDNTHLLVTSLLSEDATAETILVDPTHYTPTGAGNEAGGTIQMQAAYGTAGEQITITRLVPITQIKDYIENDDFGAAGHEQALDKLTMITQMIAENMERCVQLPVSTVGASGQALPVVALRKSMGWAFDSDGDLVVGSGLGSALGVLTGSRSLAVPLGSIDAILMSLAGNDQAAWVDMIVHAPKKSEAGAEGYIRRERGILRLIGGTYSFEMEKTIIKKNSSTESLEITFTPGASGVTAAVDGTNLAAIRTCEVRWIITMMNDDGNVTVTES